MTSPAAPPGDLLGAFSRSAHAEGGIVHDVYATGDAANPPVLVMHELPGLTDETLNFARRLAAARFRVYLPHLFGTLQKDDSHGNLRQLCVSEEFARLAADVSAPVTNWLRSLAQRLSTEHNGAAVGAVGMCLTGGFVIPLILEPTVAAPVAAQPAVPFSQTYVVLPLRKGPWARQLNVSQQDIDAAAARVRKEKDLRLLAFRFKADRICVAEKIDRLRDEFPGRVDAYEYDGPSRWPFPPHAVLTYEYERAADAGPDHPTRQAFATLVAFLDARLRAAGGSDGRHA